MTLEDRIENIKTLLKFSPQSSEDVWIVEDKVGLFFANLFNNDERFQHTHYDKVYPRIFLSEELNTDYKTHSTTIGIEYTYDADRDGEYREMVFFNDKDLEDAYFSNIGTIEYSEVPDYIWEIIQNTLNKEATKHINNVLKSAKESVKYWKNRLLEFKQTKLKQ